MHDRILGTELPSVMALSYIGDACHSLFVRKMLVERGICKSGELNAAALEYVTAEAQAKMARRIEPLLLEDEREVYRRAANSGHLNKPKHSSAAVSVQLSARLLPRASSVVCSPTKPVSVPPLWFTPTPTLRSLLFRVCGVSSKYSLTQW